MLTCQHSHKCFNFCYPIDKEDLLNTVKKISFLTLKTNVNPINKEC